MLDKKLMVMVNSDDPAYFGGYLNKNLIETQAALNLSKDEVKTLLVNSFKSSFLNEEKKKSGFLKFKKLQLIYLQQAYLGHLNSLFYLQTF